MAKLLQVSRPSKRMREVLRAWWAMRSQKRRRHGAAVVPAAPVITQAYAAWGDTEPTFADVHLEFTFEHGDCPAATLEIWCAVGEQPGPYTLVTSVASTATHFQHERVADYEVWLNYKLRYVNGNVEGPFSNVVAVHIVPP